MISPENSMTQELHDKNWTSKGVRVFIKRDDLIDPLISGNKWRKLKFNLAACKAKKKKGVITFGGAYSNHLLATAAACRDHGLFSIGIVRGEELNADSNETLRNCASLGMELHFVSRDVYTRKNEEAYREKLGASFPEYFFVPEGGANYYGMIGCQEMWKEVEIQTDCAFVAQGTATTSCGILLGMNESQKLHVVPVLKGFNARDEMMRLMMRSGCEINWVEELLGNVVVEKEWHFGGYGKFNGELIEFVRSFYRQHGVKLDPIYTGKAMYAMTRYLDHPQVVDRTVLFIHTGGLQGNSGVERKLGQPLY